MRKPATGGVWDVRGGLERRAAPKCEALRGAMSVVLGSGRMDVVAGVCGLLDATCEESAGGTECDDVGEGAVGDVGLGVGG